MLKDINIRIPGIMVDINKNGMCHSVMQTDGILSEVILLDSSRSVPQEKLPLELSPVRYSPSELDFKVEWVEPL